MKDHLRAALLHRRASDPDDANYAHERHLEEREVIVQHDESSYTRWIVGIVGAGIITLLSVLVMRDRQAIDQTLVHLSSRIAIAESRIVQIESDLVRIETKQERVLLDLAEMRKALEKNSEKLDRVLIELRRTNR